MSKNVSGLDAAYLHKEFFALQARKMKANDFHFFKRYEEFINSFTLFEKTEFIVSTVPSGKTYNIGDQIAEILPTKREGGLFDIRDVHIAREFGDILFTHKEMATGRVQRFTQEIFFNNIVAEAKQLDIHKRYRLGHALLLSNELVKKGALKECGRGTIILLKEETKGNVPCCLHVARTVDDELMIQLIRGNNSLWYRGNSALLDI